ncbi:MULTISPECIES: class I SAM-dependent methyltransferase [Pseudomonas]|uniref:Class I SAM-dependent methyltransferase n=1 Tax=Pseudomonas aphyarum TaxID=2942629 RepID=A0ABT5PSD4_9PSED|nr:class I SAM-dependent methyltransferase [Pseudomonas aphyarum]MDD0969011.1 class I SAM-dependent methyltransferase [Pseudomonas aphyarum]MDD1126838.1 class I SAM-dependent methyltransferase [Pseudomonas aphyarum]
MRERVFSSLETQISQQFFPILKTMGASDSVLKRIEGDFLDCYEHSSHLALSHLRHELTRTGLRDTWNRVLDHARSAYLAELIAPHVEGVTMDLLCGDGALAIELEKMTGQPVHLVERPKDVLNTWRPWIDRIRPFESIDVSFEGIEADTVVLSTVLHHEQFPRDLIRTAVQKTKKRLVVIENCIDDVFDAEYQVFVDLFFNTCLNETKLDSPGAHLREDEWTAILYEFGFRQVDVVERTTQVPGIPLSHTVMVASK